MSRARVRKTSVLVLASKGKFVAMYAGAMGPANDLETLMCDAAEALRGDERIHIVLVGDGKQTKAPGNGEMRDTIA